MIGFWYVFIFTDYTIFDKSIELRPYIQTVIPPDKIVLCRLGLLR